MKNLKEKEIFCPDCDGSKKDDEGKECLTCNGIGKVKATVQVNNTIRR